MNFEEKYVDGWLLLTRDQIMVAQSVRDPLYTKQYKGCMEQKEKFLGSRTYEIRLLSVAETASMQVLKQVRPMFCFTVRRGRKTISAWLCVPICIWYRFAALLPYLKR